MLTRKIHFMQHDVDPKEVAVETWAGDLTVHDGRLWYRVERCPKQGIESSRRTMYVPHITEPYEPKDDNSKMPAYHKIGAVARRAKTRLYMLRSKFAAFLGTRRGAHRRAPGPKGPSTPPTVGLDKVARQSTETTLRFGVSCWSSASAVRAPSTER